MNKNKTISTQILKNWLTFHHMPGRIAHDLSLEDLSATLSTLHLAAQDVARKLCCTKIQLTYLLARHHCAVSHALAWQEASTHHHILTRMHEAYPPLLNVISDPPAVLYVKGDVTCLQSAQIAMVGTRKPSHSGLCNAQQFASALAQQQFIVTSGLALGIDGEAHRAALAAGGKTIAVLGSGLQSVYPKRHHHLAGAIAEQGALVSEFALEASPQAWHFPLRNRIISGLSMGVLVVEAAKQSGSLITARLAGEQGRDVFAVPGSLRNLQAQGCHQLLRQGAKLVEDVSDIIEEFRLPLSAPAKKALTRVVDKVSPTYNDTELLHYFDDAPVSVDALIQQTGLSVPALLAALAELELAGSVRATPGGYLRCL